MAEPPRLELLHGGGDVVAAVEHLLEECKAGRVVGVVLCGISEGDGISDGGCGWTWAVRDDVRFAWSRLQAVVDTAQHELVAKGLHPDE